MEATAGSHVLVTQLGATYRNPKQQARDSSHCIRCACQNFEVILVDFAVSAHLASSGRAFW